ncbi:Cullin repeat-like-containing domain protein [Dunaliella salina]|uniref:Cullin repeat-like-containing domain protein n=1 Tax=Dunaliella salina TaxID=3046 RepID=A0ABQ7FUJ3_DUNSA|nr:Cullin repeat-like-containing domain protein [Dunaliella salina]|eukprot:KAF5826085.1 Cullin repeat-like-containing domain protein [Dunaliella salina]
MAPLNQGHFPQSNEIRECDLHVGAQMVALQGSVALDPVTYLERVDGMWSDYCSQLLTIRQIFLYLDRTHVIASTNVRSLFDMGLHLLRKHLDEHSQVGTRTVDGLLALIARERQGDSVDRVRLKSLLRMFNNMVRDAGVC